MQFSKCRLKLDVVSALSLVQDYNTFLYERLLSTLVANVLPVSLCLSLSLKRTLVGGRRCRSNVVVVSGRRFRPNFWTSGFHVFWCTATIGTLGRRAESAVECEQVSFVLVMQY